MTDITDATNDLILINGQRITSPYEVKAIGDQTYLYSTLSTKMVLLNIIQINMDLILK